MARLPIQNFNTQTYRFLSNFYPCPVLWRKRTYPSAEHAYQAMKTLDPEARKLIASLATPGEAKKAGRRLVLRADWEDIKIEEMSGILRAKFSDPVMENRLLDTYPAELIEGNWWGDTFWGVCEGVGENHLGKLLMELREELRRKGK